MTLARHVRTDERSVSQSPREIDPRAVGMRPRDVEAIWASVMRLYRTGLHPAIALCLRHRGQVVLERAVGHLSGTAPDEPPSATPVPVRYDSLFSLFSASKAVTAMIVHLLDERGLLGLDDRVAEYIPEFAQNGKERATIRQVLTHRSGLPTVKDFPPDLDRIADWPRVIDVLCKAPALWEPGSRLAYHAISGGFVLGEIVRRITDKTVQELLREEIAQKLGWKTFDYGTSRVRALARHSLTGIPPFPPFTWAVERALGVSLPDAVALSNDPRYYQCLIPSGNIVSNADEASQFFELLLNEGELNGVRIFEPRTIQRAVELSGVLEIDSFLGLPVRYGMGFMLGNPGPGLYGWNAPRAFGHVGFTTVLAWADPDRAMSACLMTSGKPFITPGQVRWIQAIYTIARHVPLTT